MLGHALDITAALQRDQSRPLSERHQRDREIAQAQNLLPVPASRGGRLQTIKRWWRAVVQRPDFSPDTSAFEGAALDRTRTAGAVLLFVLGCLLGVAISAAAMHYDGSAPVNLVSVLGVLVVIPTLMLLFTLLLLPGRVPGLGWLQDVLATFSPGQWLSAWINRRFAVADFGWRGRVTQTAALADAAPGGYRTLAKWQLVLYAQWLALGFFVASLCTIVLLVTFSDLAFGWSTTLNVASERAVDWVNVATAPWSGWLPAATPDAELVRQSRFYRAADLTAEQVQGLGNWWPFLLATIACYGLLPRLLLAALAALRLRRAEQQLLLTHPQVQRLFERLDTPAIAHHVDVPESAVTLEIPVASSSSTAPANNTARYPLPPGEVTVVNWNEALTAAHLQPWLAQHMNRLPSQCLTLGAQTTLAQQEQTLSELQADAIVVLTKAWEPPLLEFLDVAERLKQALPAAGMVWLIPLGIDGTAAMPADLAIWQQSIARLDDVRIRVLELT